MPSRRDYVLGLATGGLAGVAGCSGYLDRTTGVVFRKTVSVVYPTSDRGPVRVSVATLAGNTNDRTAIAQYDPEFATVDADSVRLSVSPSQAESMEQRFSDTEYVAGVVPDGEESGPLRLVHRADFNEIRVGASATVGQYTTGDGVGRFRLHGTGPRYGTLVMREHSRFDIDDTF